MDVLVGWFMLVFILSVFWVGGRSCSNCYGSWDEDVGRSGVCHYALPFRNTDKAIVDMCLCVYIYVCISIYART